MKINNPPSLLHVFWALFLFVVAGAAGKFFAGLTAAQVMGLYAYSLVTVALCVVMALKISKVEYERKIKQLLDQVEGVVHAAETRIVLDNKLLKFVEKKSVETWVITRNMENDLEDEDIIEAVTENLQKAKREKVKKPVYRYFIPDPDTAPQIKRNLALYREKYGEFLDFVEFTLVPPTSLMLFEEAVIYHLEEKGGIRHFGYTFVDLEGSGGESQVVRLGDDNVKAILNDLGTLINPADEAHEKLWKKLLHLREKFNNDQSAFKDLATIVSEKQSLYGRKEETRQVIQNSKVSEKIKAELLESLEAVHSAGSQRAYPTIDESSL